MEREVEIVWLGRCRRDRFTMRLQLSWGCCRALDGPDLSHWLSRIWSDCECECCSQHRHITVCKFPTLLLYLCVDALVIHTFSKLSGNSVLVHILTLVDMGKPCVSVRASEAATARPRGEPAIAQIKPIHEHNRPTLADKNALVTTNVTTNQLLARSVDLLSRAASAEIPSVALKAAASLPSGGWHTARWDPRVSFFAKSRLGSAV